jgi:hypothetical protein
MPTTFGITPYAQPTPLSSWKPGLAGGNAHGWFQEGLDKPDAVQGDQAKWSALRTACHDEIRPQDLWGARWICCGGEDGLTEPVAEVPSFRRVLSVLATGKTRRVSHRYRTLYDEVRHAPRQNFQP